MREVQYLPIATVEVDEQGNMTLLIDWADSEQGEFNRQTGEIEVTPLSIEVSQWLDAWHRAHGIKGEQRIPLGKLSERPS